MYVTKTLENKNLRINFVEGIRYLEAKAYYNQKRGTYHWKRVYASDSKASPKKNTQEVFKNSGNNKVVIVVEEETNKARKYTVYIEYSVKIEKFSYSPNRIITQEVIDACDDVKVKLLLMKHANKYKLVSSMGTANKTDPSKLSITTLDKTSGDPLAKTLRKKVKENRIRTKFKVVSSTEVPTKNKDKVLGTVCYMPGVAGLLCASYVINDITK